MKRNTSLALIMSVSMFCLSVLPAAYAALQADQVMKMTQGQFALALLKEAGALGRLSPAADAEDAIDFLQSLGIVPEGGWELDKMVDEDFLKRLIEGSGGDASGGTIDELLAELSELVSNAVSGLAQNQNVNPGGVGVSG